MPFKIVKTIENGKLCSLTVPANWEKDGILRSPKFQFEQFRRDPSSVPQETWQTNDCILSKSNVRSFVGGELECQAMTGVLTNRETTNHNAPAFETMIAEILVAEGSRPESTQQTIIAKAKEAKTNNIIEISPSQYSKLSSQLDILSAKVSDMQKKQEEIFGNQEMIINKLSEMSSRLDERIKQASVSTLAENTKHTGRIKTITDKKGLDELEESLRNEHTALEIKTALSIICGEGKGRAGNNAYALIDAMFCRKFLLECSWSGGSRGESSKVCFKSYRNVLNLFFEIIYSSDKQFTIMECENFFKSVLKNSRKRCHSKMMRASRIRNRAKKNHIENSTDDDEVLDLGNIINDIVNGEPARPVKVEHEPDEEDSDYLL